MTQTATLELQQPWGTTPEGEFTRVGIILAFVMGSFAVFITFPLGIIGIVLSCIGLDRIQRGDPSARKFLRWSWICFVPGGLIGTALVILVLLSLWSRLLTWLLG